MKFKIIIICSLLMLLGCSLINGPSKVQSFENFSYPLEVGNKWVYERTVTYSNIQPDTVQLPFPLGRKGLDIIEVVSAVGRVHEATDRWMCKNPTKFSTV